MAKKILLADDSITIQKVVELTFAEGDYEVVCANDGAQAIRKIEENPPDIALIDVMMPQRNGYDVCAHVKQDPDLAWIPVLLLTGTFEPFDPRRSEQVGANGHIVKPFESRSLVAQVEELIAKNPRPGMAVAGPEPVAASAEPAPPAPREPEADDPGPATVRLDSKDFFAQFQGNEPPVDSAPPASEEPPPSLGPLDLAAQNSDTEPTGPVPAVPAEREEAAPAAPAAGNKDIDALLQEKLSQITEPLVREAVERIVREVVWEIVPEVAEAKVTRRIRELEEKAESQKGASLH